MLETFQSHNIIAGALGTDGLLEQGTMFDCLMIMWISTYWKVKHCLKMCMNSSIDGLGMPLNCKQLKHWNKMMHTFSVIWRLSLPYALRSHSLMEKIWQIWTPLETCPKSYVTRIQNSTLMHSNVGLTLKEPSGPMAPSGLSRGRFRTDERTEDRTDDRTMAAGASVTWTHCSVLFEVTWG
jgi:hypothetical protein